MYMYSLYSCITSLLPPSPPYAQDGSQPIMCSYKVVKVSFEVWGLQTRVEEGVHKVSGMGGEGSGVVIIVFFSVLLSPSLPLFWP